MPGNDGEKLPMVENARVPARQTAPGSAPASEPSPGSGCVEKTLTLRDRNLIVGACITYAQQEGKRKVQDQANLDRVKRLLDFEETVEYFAMTNDWVEEQRIRWEGSRAKYRAWLQWKEGVVSTEDLLKAYPNFVLDDRKLPAQPQKPPFQAPRLKPEEYLGTEGTFRIPAKLYLWIEGALKTMEWPTEKMDMTEGSAELGRKFGLVSEE